MNVFAEKMHKIDNYNQTTQAIVSLCHFLEYDYSAKTSIGRKMKTSKNNKHSPNEIITPDFIANIKNYGIVCEVKKSFPNTESFWLKEIQQLEKYDDELDGWKTASKKVDKHDILLLTHVLRSRRVSKYIEKKIKEGKIIFERNYAVVEFNRSDETQTFCFLRLERGQLDKKEIQERLDDGLAVPLEKIIPSLVNIKFYDEEPETEYVMAWLWTGVFNKTPEAIDYRLAFGKKTIDVEISTDRAFENLRESCGPPIEDKNHQIHIPKKKWVKKALENFVKIDLATKSDEDTYAIKYHRVKGQKEILNLFIARLHEADKQKTLGTYQENTKGQKQDPKTKEEKA